MIKFENFQVVGWEHAIRGMRNPKNSWERSDSEWMIDLNPLSKRGGWFDIGPNDHSLMMRLRNAGTDHRKFMRQIIVYVDITAPLYWWKEFDTYKVGTVANSCSTMHTIHEKEFTLDDFSIEKLYMTQLKPSFGPTTPHIFAMVVDALNFWREQYNETKEKLYWEQMIQLLPTSYNQKRTVMMNYEVLANIYHSRKNHKLQEWHDLCDWAASLPYGELITGSKESSNDEKTTIESIFEELDGLMLDYTDRFVPPAEFVARVSDLKKKFTGSKEGK